LFASNALQERMKNNWVAMPLLSPQQVEAGGKLQMTRGDSSGLFVSRPSKLPGLSSMWALPLLILTLTS
ncbi:hypothetical protein KCU83_g292, partial [Aureobasidium melanogenum]